jgi:hypothetical protein
MVFLVYSVDGMLASVELWNGWEEIVYVDIGILLSFYNSIFYLTCSPYTCTCSSFC